jgi:hypothetical protein
LGAESVRRGILVDNVRGGRLIAEELAPESVRKIMEWKDRKDRESNDLKDRGLLPPPPQIQETWAETLAWFQS